MPSTLIFKPIEAKLTRNTDFFTKMNPYCAFTVGGKCIKSQVCKKGGKAPHWNDTVTVSITKDESNILIEVMDKDKITKDDHIGSFEFNLQEIEALGQIKKWLPLVYKKKSAGELQMEVIFERDNPEYETIVNQPQKELEVAQEQFIQEAIITDHPEKVYIEQRQVIEPHTFIKEVDVLDTRLHIEHIEIIEPQKMIKEVEHTGIVTKEIQPEAIVNQEITKSVGPVTLLGVPQDFKESVSFKQSKIGQESLMRSPEEEHILGDSVRSRMQKYSISYHNQHHQEF